jgi:hypothetical protein
MTALEGPVDAVDPQVRARFVVDSGWFDADWYRAHHPAARDADDPLEHWLTVGAPEGVAPGPQILALQDQRGDHLAVSVLEPEPPAADDPQLLRDIALVSASSLFDEDYYLSQVDDLEGETAVSHFCRLGWRLLLRPCRGFDVWWYWSTYLDPAGESLDPFVHYLALGRAAGFPGQPTSLAGTGGWVPPTDRPMRRICLFAGFDAQGRVDDTVVAYVRELSRFADVYYLADSYLPDRELAKLEGITRGAWAVRHGCYDFGSYSMLAHELVGWETVRSYDELLLVNDSCYLLRPLDEVFAAMDERPCDWWGLQATKGLIATVDAPSNQFRRPIPMALVREEYLRRWEDDDVYDFHVGSYFVAYRRPVLDDTAFGRLLESVHRQRGKAAIIHKYEIGITHLLLSRGHAFDTWIDAVHPFHPLFTEHYFDLVGQGFPLLKRYLLYQNHYDVPGLRDWRARMTALVPGADLDPVEAHLHRTAPHDRLVRSFAIEHDRPAPARPDREAVRALDRDTPRFDHWWAFPVDPDLDDLAMSVRAVFEEVRDDPTIHKVVLTRGRPLGLDGARVTELPVTSPEGLDHLVRCGQVFVLQLPHRTLGNPLILRNRDVHLVGDHPRLLTWGALSADAKHDEVTPSPVPVPTAASHLAVSDVDHVAVTAAHRGAKYADVWRVGSPARDLLVRDAGLLPSDIRDAEQRVRDRLGGRRLLLVAPALRPDASADLVAAAAERLAAWAARTDVVVGVREDRRDLARLWSHATDGWALDLSPHVEPLTAAVLRASDAVLTDFHGAAVTMATLGRPVISHPCETAPITDLVHDLDRLFPGAVCRTPDDLTHALDRLFVPEDELDDAVRARLARARRAWTDGDQVDDDRSARRFVRRVRQRYTAVSETP